MLILISVKLNTMKTESRRNVKMLKEEVQKLDDLYQQSVKVGAWPVCSSDSTLKSYLNVAVYKSWEEALKLSQKSQVWCCHTYSPNI